MEKYLKEHIIFIEKTLQKENQNFNWDALSDFNQRQIGFFQHERWVHLWITFFFGLMFFNSVIAELWLANSGDNLIFFNGSLLVINAILLVMLGFYIGHYFVLENGIQKLYRLEKEIIKRGRKIENIK